MTDLNNQLKEAFIAHVLTDGYESREYLEHVFNNASELAVTQFLIKEIARLKVENHNLELSYIEMKAERNNLLSPGHKGVSCQ